MGQSLDIPRVIPDDWKRLDLIINKIKFKLGRGASPTLTGLTITGLTASALVGTDASKALESITIGTGLAYVRPTLSLSHLGIEALTDPGADKILFWDDGASASKWLGMGDSIVITDVTIDTIQDIQTSASPTFAGGTFTGVVIGVTPTAGNHLVTKEYVDLTLGARKVFFLSDTGSDVGPLNYAYPHETTDDRSTIVTDPALGADDPDPQLIKGFITEVGEPATTTIHAGVIIFHLHAKKGASNQRTTVLKAILSKVAANGTSSKVAIATTENSEELTDAETAYTLHATLGVDVEILSTDRLILDVYASVGSGALGAVITLYLEGTEDSYFSATVDSGIWQTYGAVLDDLNTLGQVGADSEFLVGTGAGVLAWENAATARTSMGVAASGHDHSGVYQPLDVVLTDIAALDVVADNEFIVGTGAGVYAHESGATARTSLGLGTGDSPTFAGLHINSPAVDNVTLLTLESDISNNTEYNEILFKVSGGKEYGAIRSYVGNTTGDSYMAFLTSTTSGGVLVRHVTIQHNGFTGFGTWWPGERIHVVGNALISGVIELGHASDTTISRVSAGVIAVEGTTVMMVGDAPTSHTHDDRYYTETEIGDNYQPLSAVLTDLTGLFISGQNHLEFQSANNYIYGYTISQLHLISTGEIHLIAGGAYSLKVIHDLGCLFSAGIYIVEQASAGGSTATYGQIWTKSGTPNTLWFTDDTGDDFQLGVGGGADEKVKIDSGATAGYIGAASGDGVLRTTTGLSYVDGGDFITLGLSHLGFESLTSPTPNDRIPFWDNSASTFAWLSTSSGIGISGTSIGLAITGLSLEATPDGANDYVAISDGATHNKISLNGIFGQGLQTTASPTFAGIIIANGGTIGNGVQLAFDDTNDYFEITGCDVIIGGTVPTKKLDIVIPDDTGGAGLIIRNSDGSISLTNRTGTANAFQPGIWGIGGTVANKYGCELIGQVTTDDVGDVPAFAIDGRNSASALSNRPIMGFGSYIGTVADFKLIIPAAGGLKIKEQASASGDIAGFGQIYVKNITPCQLWFRRDDGSEFRLDA